MAYFKKRDHGKEAGYDSYKTKAANLSANRRPPRTVRFTARRLPGISRSPNTAH